jgi:hypothetical protein
LRKRAEQSIVGCSVQCGSVRECAKCNNVM